MPETQNSGDYVLRKKIFFKSKNKFDRNPVSDSISEFSFPNSIPEVSVSKTNPETENPVDTNDSAAASSGYVYAEGYKSVRLRKEPNENAEVVTTVPVGENILIGETINGWAKVNWLSFSGWMMDKYIVRH